MAMLNSAVSVALIALLFPLAQYIIQKLSRSILLPFCLGLVFVPALKKGIKLFLRWRHGKHEEISSSSVYGLDHAVLNLELPPRSMWMNMGYWEDTTTDLPTACSALLEQVLKRAGLLLQPAATLGEKEEDDSPPPLSPVPRRRRRPVHIIDIGIGCGDQTEHLLRLSRTAAETRSGAFPAVDAYVGITKDPQQFRYARAAIARRVGDMTPNGGPLNVFCGDAADAKSWTDDFVHATKAHMMDSRWPSSSEKQQHQLEKQQQQQQQQQEEDGPDTTLPDVWVLGLDCLYHLDPYRLPLFIYAHGIGAGIMAFDLLLPDEGEQELSLLQKALLWTVCQLTGSPWDNFMTSRQYRQQLVDAGYDKEKIEIVDISGRVFQGLSSFLERRDQELHMIGKGLGPFHVAKWIFGWWARTGVVRGCVVVARR